MIDLKYHKDLAIPKKVLLRIDDKDITFKGSQSYQGLVLLENSSLIKCSYLCEGEDRELYTIKVYNFENENSVNTFIRQTSFLKTIHSESFPEIVEVISEKEIHQVLVVESFTPCLSLKILLEEASSIDGMLEKIHESLCVHKLVIKIFDALYELETKAEYHGFLNISNICIRPSITPQNCYEVKDYIDAIINDFSIVIWDLEAHKYWEIITSKAIISKNPSPWKSILFKNQMLEAPEFEAGDTARISLSLHYDLWMAAVVLIQMVFVEDQRKTDLYKEWSPDLHKINYDERAHLLKEFFEDSLLCRVLSSLLKDSYQRPLPSELLENESVKQLKQLLSLDSRDEKGVYSFEVLLLGLGSSEGSVSLKALEYLCEEGVKKEGIFENIVQENIYLHVLNRLKQIQRSNGVDSQQKIIENGFKLLSMMLGYDRMRHLGGFKAGGVINLILRGIEQDLSQEILCELISYYGQGSTETLMHFVEKSGLVGNVVGILKRAGEEEESRWTVQKKLVQETGHFYKLPTVLDCAQFLTDEELFTLLLRIPLMKRTDYLALKIMKKLLIQYGKKFIAEGDTADKSTLDTYYQLLFSWFFIRNIIIYTGCHLECPSATLPKDTKVPYDNGFCCRTCSELPGVSNKEFLVCARCAFTCHKEHELVPIGFRYFACECNNTPSKMCKVQGPQPLPSFLLNQNENYLDPLKITFAKAPKHFKYEVDKNIFLNNDGELGTIVTTMSLCNVTGPESPEIDSPVKGTERTIGYYEVEIKLGGFYDQNAIGWTTNHQYPKDEFAGYLEDSIAYHGDDGTVYLNGEAIGQLCSFGSNDIVGCGITNFGTVFFTHNGVLLTDFLTYLKGPVFPVISLRGKYSSIQVNFEGMFMFNYEDIKENVDNNDLIRFMPLLVLESLFIQPEWFETLEALHKMKPEGWLGQIVYFITDRRERAQLYREQQEKEFKMKQENLLVDKDFDVLKELHSVDMMLKETKRSVQEFTSGIKDFEYSKQDSQIGEGGVRVGAVGTPSKFNPNYSDSKNATISYLRDINLNVNSTTTRILEKPPSKQLELSANEPIDLGKKSKRKGLCSSSKKENKKTCEIF